MSTTRLIVYFAAWVAASLMMAVVAAVLVVEVVRLVGIAESGSTSYEVVLNVQFPSNISDWGPIAAQVRDADPDFLYVGALGVDGPNLIAAMDALDYRPAGMFFQTRTPSGGVQVA